MRIASMLSSATEIVYALGASEYLTKPLDPRRLLQVLARYRADTVLPVLVVLSLFASLSWFGLFRVMPDGARLPVLGVLGAAALAALYPLRFYRRPSAVEIDRRIERANDLAHTPVLVQTETGASPLRVIAVPLPPADAEAARHAHERGGRKRATRAAPDCARLRTPWRCLYHCGMAARFRRQFFFGCL